MTNTLQSLQSFAKIAGALVISYFLGAFASNIFFVGNTPILRSHPEQYIAQKLSHPAAAGTALTVQDYKEFMSSSAAKAMKEVSKGTYATEIKGKKVTIIKLNEIPLKEYTYTLKSGKQIKVKVPLDSAPPSQKDIERE